MLFEWFNRTKVSHNLGLIGWFAAELRSTIEIESSKPCFILQSFLTRNTVSPLAVICGMDSSSSPRHSFFFWLHFKIWDWSLYAQKVLRGWYCVGFFSIYCIHLRLPILEFILRSLNATYTFNHKIKLTLFNCQQT